MNKGKKPKKKRKKRWLASLVEEDLARTQNAQLCTLERYQVSNEPNVRKTKRSNETLRERSRTKGRNFRRYP